MVNHPIDIDRIAYICHSNDVSVMWIFGSAARGEAREDSDIDLLVRFTRRKSLLALVKLGRELSEELGRKVDLLTEASVSPYLRDQVMADLRVVYEAR